MLAAGSGSRVGAAGNKVYLPLAGRPVLAWSLRAFVAADVSRLVLVIRPEDRPVAMETVRDHVPGPVELVEGGAARHDSEYAALALLAPDIRAGVIDAVAIHDGARPLLHPDLVHATVRAALTHGAAVPGVAVEDLVLRLVSAGPAAGGGPSRVGSADGAWAGPRLVRVQTPQAFRAGPLLDSYERAAVDGFAGTDTAACVERYAGMRVHHVPGDPRNIKVTYRRDLAVAAALLEGSDTG